MIRLHFIGFYIGYKHKQIPYNGIMTICGDLVEDLVVCFINYRVLCFLQPVQSNTIKCNLTNGPC